MITAVEHKRVNLTTGKPDLAELGGVWGRLGRVFEECTFKHSAQGSHAASVPYILLPFFLQLSIFPSSLFLPKGALTLNLKILLWISSVKVTELLHLPGLNLEDGEDICPRYLRVPICEVTDVKTLGDYRTT